MLALAALLLTLWIHTGQTLRNCPEDRLYVHTIVPCLDAPKGGSNSNPCPPVQSLFECDHLVYGAVELAVSHLNSRSSTPLPATNTTIQLMAFGQDIAALLESMRPLFVDGTVYGSVGPSELDIAEFFTPVITDRIQIPSILYNLPQEDIVSSGLFYRTLPSTTYIAEALVALMDYFQWYKIGVVHTGNQLYLERTEIFMQMVTAYLNESTDGRVEDVLTEIFSTEEQLEHVIDYISDSNIRIIFAFAEELSAVSMLCKARQAGLTGSDNVWVLPSYTNPEWWKEQCTMCNCTTDEIKEALESVLFVAPMKYLPFAQELGGYAPEVFRQELLDLTLKNLQDGSSNDSSCVTRAHLSQMLAHSNALSAYDAIWTVAKVWDSVLSTLDCDTSSSDHVTIALEEALDDISEMEFRYLWEKDGCVFDDHANDSQKYYGQVIITQFQGGSTCPVAVVLPHDKINGEKIVPLSTTANHSCPAVVELGEWVRNFSHSPTVENCTYDFKWRGSSAPVSGLFIETSEISKLVLVVIFILTVVITVLTITAAIFNIVHRENKFIKATSPRLSIPVTISLLLPLPTPLCVGLVASSHSIGFSELTANVLCRFSVWLPLFGVPLLYSTLLVKNYRIFRIFYNKKLKNRGDSRLGDHALIVAISLSLVPPLIVSLVSNIVSPVMHEEVLIRIKEASSSYHFVQVSHCTELPRTIRILFFTYINLILVPTIILSLHTMKIPTRFGTDGRATAGTVLTLYTAVWIFTLVYLSVDIKNHPERYISYFNMIVAYIFLHNLVTLLFLYLPTYYHMYLEHKESIVLSARQHESDQQSQRVEHYRKLKARTVDLREQLNEIEMKLRKENALIAVSEL